ncbi:MAG: helix-turn-helix domain-containing protein [Acidobacteria bacterium]|nr:helix-turn-helix domain-containing protein [Acidobacteriota bacterium]
MKKKMKIQTGNFQALVGKRLTSIRKGLGFNRSEMAAKLGLSPATYYKNETGFFLPGLDTLYCLHTEFDISLDWFLFGSEPIHNKEKQHTFAPEIKTMPLENTDANTRELRELLADMEQDPLLLHEIMLYYYKYKKNQKTTGSQSDMPGESQDTIQSQVD